VSRADRKQGPYVREWSKWLLFPGVNLHARLRRKVIPPLLGSARPGEDRLVLDAGCGNGMLAYEGYLRGNQVVAVSIDREEVERCQRLFHAYLGIPEDRLSFRAGDLYDIEDLGLEVDEIICTEVMEHIVDDERVCQSFWRMLRPGGTLHLCCPNAEHPDNRASTLDEDEAGGHVRDGYTLATYRALLEPIGFEVQESRGLGGPVRQAFNRRILHVEETLGFFAAFLVFLISLPFLFLDPRSPRVPYSLYVRAVRPGRAPFAQQ